MSSSTSIEQQHQEFKRQMSAHDTYPCFLLDQTFQQRLASPNSTPMPSFLSAQALTPLAKSPLAANQSRLSAKPSNQYRLFPSSPSNNSNANRTGTSNPRSTTQIVDVPIERTIVPLRTMADLFPSFSYTNMRVPHKRSPPSSHRTNSPLSSSTGAVSIFGFREEDLEILLQQFQDIGPIEHIERPMGCAHGNFLNVTYSNNVSSQNALNRDGMLFNGYMIGVVPLLNK